MGTGVGYAFIGAVALAIFTIAHTRAMKMKEQSRIAAEMFWYAGGALPLTLACVFLAANGDLPMIPQRIILFCVGGFMGGTTLVGIGEWIHPLPANAQTTQGGAMNDHPQVVISGGDNVVSVGQLGGITARVVTINPPVNPELRIIGRTEIDNPDGSHTVTIKLRLRHQLLPAF